MSDTSSNTMDLIAFTKVFRDITENSKKNNQCDLKDKEVLALLILGYWPKRALAISREYDGDAMVYHYKDAQEQKVSMARRMQMKSRCKPPYDGLRDEPVYAVRRFWNTYLPSKATSEGGVDDNSTLMTWEIYRDIILTGSQWLRTEGSMISKGRITAPNELNAMSKSSQTTKDGNIKGGKNDIYDKSGRNISNGNGVGNGNEDDSSRLALAALS